MRKVAISVVVLIMLVAGAWLGRTGYRHWKQEHLVNQARYFLTQSDVPNALLCLQKAIQSNPSNVGACRMFADLAEMSHSPAAVQWRHRVAELEPKVLNNRIAWAKTALLMGDLQAANEALTSVDEAGRKTAEFHKSVAALAWALKQMPQAESNYLEAVRLEPTNLVSRINLASIQLLSKDTNKVNQARLALQQLATNPAVRLSALRTLVKESSHDGTLGSALNYSDELVSDPQSGFSDRMLRLGVLNQAKSAQLSAYLASLQRESATNGYKAFEVGKWMYDSGRTNETISWVGSLPPSVRTNLPVPLLLAEIYTTLNRWEDLEVTLKGQNWGDSEYMRHLLLAKAYRSQGDSLASSAEWRSALKGSTRRLECLNELGKRTAVWGWEAELDETLWAILDNFPLDKPAFLLLYDRLHSAGNTAGLRNLLAKISAAVPSNNDLENNLALVSLLLNSHEGKGHDLAKDVYTKDPKNPYFLSTYAYSLYLQHKTNEALNLFGSLSSEQLTNAGVAFYYGVILKESGNAVKAKPYLELAKGAKLLPEEQKLAKKAMEGI